MVVTTYLDTPMYSQMSETDSHSLSQFTRIGSTTSGYGAAYGPASGRETKSHCSQSALFTWLHDVLQSMRMSDVDGLWDHPDLRNLAARMQLELEQALEAEFAAAALSASRRSTLRDRLIEFEQRPVVVYWLGGTSAGGTVTAVGVDYLELRGPAAIHLVPLLLVERVELQA